jgi:cholesterol oxidase
VAAALGAEYKDNPAFRFNFHQFMSAHPLGGCSMGETKQQGVVSAGGEVFDYPGFYIADGSVLPGPAGVNPALTIAALADRFADHLLAQQKKPV